MIDEEMRKDQPEEPRSEHNEPDGQAQSNARQPDGGSPQAQPPVNEAEEAPVEEPTENTIEKEMETIKAELEQAQVKCKEYFEGWQRERADFINYKKRIDREQAQMRQDIAGSVIKQYLVILDDLERALAHRPADGQAGSWAEGIELIYRKLKGVLEAEGLKRIPAENAEFDPNLHEAVSHEDSADHKSGTVIEVLQQGYMIGDRVLRPALVRVAR